MSRAHRAGLDEPLASARPAAGLSSGPLLLALIAPALAGLGAQELEPGEGAAAMGLLALGAAAAAVLTAPLRTSLAHLTAERLRLGDTAALAPQAAGLVAGGAALGALGGAAAFGLLRAGAGAPLFEGVLAASLGALTAVALLGAEAVTAGGDRDTVLGASWVGAAAGGGLAALGARLGGLDGALVGGSVGVLVAAAVLLGRFFGASRHAPVALEPAALYRALRRPLPAVVATLATLLWVLAPHAGSLGGARSAAGGWDAAGLAAGLGAREAAAAALAMAPALMAFFATEERSLALAHTALARAIERGGALAALADAASAAERATARAAVRVLVFALALAALCGGIASEWAPAESALRVRLALAALVPLAAALPGLQGLLHLGRDGLALATFAPLAAWPVAVAAGAPAAGALVGVLGVHAALALGVHATAVRQAPVDLVVRDASLR